MERLTKTRKADPRDWSPDLSDWAALVAAFAPELHDEFMYAVDRFLDAGINAADILVLDRAALDFAQARAAEMVGMRLVDGELVPNPSAEWAITESTRTAIRDLVNRAIEDGLSPQQLREAITESAAFSKARASMVARTELALAHVAGSLDGARKAGVTHKRWLTNPDSPTAASDQCGVNESQKAIPLEELFTSGQMGPPAHPRCECSLVFSFANA